MMSNSEARKRAAENEPSADVEALAARIAAGRVRHGVGASEDFPGNVCHLVSPIVGLLRLRQRDDSPVGDLGHIIDRLSLVLDMAEQAAASDWLAAHTAAARAEALMDAADALEVLVDSQHPDALNPDQWLRDRADDEAHS